MNLCSQTHPRRHSTMDYALACHAGSQGLNPDKTKEDYFLFGKIKKMGSYPLWYLINCFLSLSFNAVFYENTRLTCYGVRQE